MGGELAIGRRSRLAAVLWHQNSSAAAPGHPAAAAQVLADGCFWHIGLQLAAGTGAVRSFSSNGFHIRGFTWCHKFFNAVSILLLCVCSWGDLGDEFYAALEQRAETVVVAALHGGACAACGQALPHSSGMLRASDWAQEVLRSVLQVSLP